MHCCCWFLLVIWQWVLPCFEIMIPCLKDSNLTPESHELWHNHNEQNSEIRCTVCTTPWFRHNFWTSCWMPKNYKLSQMFSMQRVFGKILGVSSLWLARLPAAFVAKFMSIYKKFLIATFGWGSIWFYTKNFLCHAQFHCTT
jgi:hypothetical protein